MTQQGDNLILRPVAWVRNGVHDLQHPNWEELVSEIEVEPDLEECLDGIEGFSHINVIFWFHRITPEERAMKKFHPHDREDLPLLGAFATRSQRRPNPLGLTTVRLLGREGNRLRVQGLDAVDGTPVVDIKPYALGFDYSAEANQPEWLGRVRR